MKNSLRMLTIVAAALFALAASSNAQTWVFNGAGSSAAYLEVGEAAAYTLSTTTGSPSAGDVYQCLWTAPSGVLVATDPTTGQTENGQSWVAWNIDTSTGGTTCASPGTGISVYSYEQTDSVVGNRLLFNGSSTAMTSAGAGATSKLLIYTGACETNGWITTGPDAEATPAETCDLPSSVQTLLETSTQMTAAGTDIRPEDAEFATVRALTTCGQAIPFTISGENTTQYLGLGYTSGGTPIESYYGSGTFHVTSFTLPAGGYSVYRFGAAPMVVQVNQTDGTALSAGGAGFANTAITNITSSQLANFLDGTSSRTGDLLPPGSTATSEGVTVLIRENLSGTYNTMEYNIPNTIENQTSMDVGELQNSTQQNCSSGAPKSNPMDIATKAGARTRVIGTGEMENVLFGTGTEGALPFPSVLGWSFWSKPNLQNAYSGKTDFNTDARYLTVDGIDPIQTTYTGGTIPTTANGLLTNVTMANIVNGSYPIWSFIRLVCIGNGSSAACSAASSLASNSQNYVALGASVDALHPPDFVPVANTVNTAWNSIVVRSHFTPPGIPTPACNGTGTLVSNGAMSSVATEIPECGGDVGGTVYTIKGDTDYANDFQSGLGVKKTGENQRRR